MQSYVALLGHQPILSQAELSAVLPDFSVQRMFGKQFLTFETKEKLDQNFFNTLGGTVMLAMQISLEDIDLDDVPTILATELSGVSGKAKFSLRCEGIPRTKIKELYRSCKDTLRSRGISSRYIGNDRTSALPVQLHDEGLLDPKSGCEIVILCDQKNIWIGRTVAAQDTKAYTLRDVEKPVRDTTTGLMPPKLAQILLNFGLFLLREKKTKASSELTVFDPFCGSGVIPLEVMLREWHILASDVSKKAENSCKKNIEWTRKTFDIPKKKVKSAVWKHDATKPFAMKEKPDIIVSETSLGPNLKSRPALKDAEKMRKDNEKLQKEFLKNVAASLPGVPLVLTWPTWYTKKRPSFLEGMEKACEELGYTFLLPPSIEPAIGNRKTLLYRRKNQFVGREIVLLQPSTS